jgi:[ribosomal protein S18]-alanine N-acetyltransferase
MKRFFQQLFRRAEPVLTPAGPNDAQAFAMLHGKSFKRGWSDGEFELLLRDRNVIAHRATIGRRLAGFLLSRIAADEAEILSAAVAGAERGRGIAGRLLELHLRRLAGLGVRAVFLEVEAANMPARRLYARAGFREVGQRKGYYVEANGTSASALVLRRDLP